MGSFLPPYHGSVRKRQFQKSKFYFFDPGVAHALCGIRHLDPSSDLFGRAFEQFIACELRACLSYTNSRLPLRHWRSKSKFEVDFVVGDKIAIEAKAGARMTPRDHKGLLALKEERKWPWAIIVSRDPVQAKFKNGIQHWPWELFLKDLWRGKFF